MKRISASAMVAAFLVALVWAQGPSQFRPGFNLFSKDQDIQLGQENAALVRKHVTVVRNPYLSEYVTRVGQRLVSSREAQESGFPFTFEVVADPSINAFALPGGPMFINTGLLKAVDNEAQLAGVMGHEMSHVILRHSTNQASKSKFVELSALVGSQVARGSLVGQLLQLGIGPGVDSVLLKFSRSAESQADLMGSHLMAEAGYNPIEMARFFEKLNAEGGSRAPQFLSDHPNPENREKAIEQEITRLPQQNYGYQTGDFQRMKVMVSKIREPKPPAPAQAQEQK
jgi:beta-barrel assembly-enhancing protease